MRDTIANRLKELMKYYDINQTDFAARTNLYKSAISNYLKGIREPRQQVITKICQEFDISEAWLMGFDVPMTDTPSHREELSSLLGSILREGDSDKIELILEILKLDNDKWELLRVFVNGLKREK